MYVDKAGVKIVWEIDAQNWDDAGPGSRQYKVWRSGVQIATFGEGSDSYVDQGGEKGRPYLYQVEYVNSNGKGSFTKPVTGADADLNAPGSFALTSPDNQSSGQPLSPTLEWGDSTDATTYDLYFLERQVRLLNTYKISKRANTTFRNWPKIKNIIGRWLQKMGVGIPAPALHGPSPPAELAKLLYWYQAASVLTTRIIALIPGFR